MRINFFSLATQMRFHCKFGSQRRRVLLFACDTLLPDMGRLPVMGHTFAITDLLLSVSRARSPGGGTTPYRNFWRRTGFRPTPQSAQTNPSIVPHSAEIV